MTRKEKELYHQIHPLKLVTDISSDVAALYFFWQHQLGAGLAVVLFPALAVSFFLIYFSDLESYKKSRLGKYLKRQMTLPMQGLRVIGGLAMLIGAWNHDPAVIVVGLILIFWAWFGGIIL